jgi:hypothetical protein
MERGDEIPYGEPMRRYVIRVIGCDDRTVIARELDDAQAALVADICKQISAASTYGCMPIMEIADGAGLCDHGEPANDCWKCQEEAGAV